MRIVMMASVAFSTLVLAGCATPPRVAHDGALPALAGQALAAPASPAAPTGTDVALAKAIEAQVMSRLVAGGADASGARPPAYLVQVAVGTSAPAVGVSAAAGPLAAQAPWRSAPTRLHPWSRRGPVRVATLVVLDVATGKPTGWATARSSSADATDLADRLVAALSSPPGKG
ncbi:hypothetical protein PMI01_03074 [Caulobacter sp. AP07]|uniref:hypothetical protein n=1 Tax=Caulobacter sp. AP07 TaxID=1144304 RepID=UPI000271F2C0|nr:hypothetical protein [Caulobacter sp. AP07]EJL30682.1 hypothetical protein PMI01_03074 [Caulobacter sp. AP07]